MLSCSPNLLSFCLLFSPILPSMGWLCGDGVFGLIVFSLSPDQQLNDVMKDKSPNVRVLVVTTWSTHQSIKTTN